MTSLDIARHVDAPADTLHDVRFAVVDVETSGLDVERHRVLQVAVVVVDADGNELDRCSTTVRPRYGLLSRVGPRHIHGISRWSLRNARPVDEVIDLIAPRLHDAVVTGHNVAFDVAFLLRMADRAHRTLNLTPTLCTLELSRRLDPERQHRHRLTDLSVRYGVGHERPHDALSDAQATAAVLPALLTASGITTHHALQRVMRPAPQA